MANRLEECSPSLLQASLWGRCVGGDRTLLPPSHGAVVYPHLHNHVVEEEQEVDGLCCYHEGVPAVSEGVQAQALKVHMCKEGSWEAKHAVLTSGHPSSQSHRF